MSSHINSQTVETMRAMRTTDHGRRERRLYKEQEVMEKVTRVTGPSARRAIARLLLTLAGVGLAAPAAHAQFTSGSSGIHGVFPPTPESEPIPSNYTYLVWNVKTGGVRYCSAYTTGTGLDVCDTNSNPNVFAQIPGIPAGGLTSGVYQFSDFEIGTIFGIHREIIPVNVDPNTPLVILSQTDIEFVPQPNGYSVSLRVNGWNGQSALNSAQNLAVVGGRGGPGGFGGGSSGNGGATPGDGNPGYGPSGGSGGDAQAAAQAGLNGVNAQASAVNPSLTPLTGGSGGGGGAGASGGTLGCNTSSTGYAGGGGGGGAGAVLLSATGRVSLSSGNKILAHGGNGGYNPYSGCNQLGAGGGGGSVRIVANEFTGGGTIDLNGGGDINGNNRAPGGQLRVETNFNTFTGPVNGSSGNSSFLSFPTAPLPLNQPVLRITSIGGSAAPTNPSASLGIPDITFANAVEGNVTVAVAAANVPLGTTVNIRVVPAVGATMSAVSTPLGGSVANSTAQASVTLPPGAGVVTATASFNVGGSGLALNALPLIDGQRPTQVEVVALADGTSKAYLVGISGTRVEMGPSPR